MRAKQFRIERFFLHSNHSLIVAVDHGMMLGAAKGIENLSSLLGKLISSPVNGLLVSPAGIRIMREQYPKSNLPLICSIDYIQLQTVTDRQDKSCSQYSALWKMEDAVKYGADAVKVFLNFGDDNEMLMNNMDVIRSVFRESEQYNIPVMVEILFLNNTKFDNPQLQPQLLSDACRLTYELGADMLKVPIIDQTEIYKEIMTNIPLPLFALGGSKMNEEALNRVAENLVQSGINGLVFGRNVWSSQDMDKVIRDLQLIVHG